MSDTEQLRTVLQELKDQKGLSAALSATLEKANREIDRLRRELDEAQVELDEAQFRVQEAEGARGQVQQTLKQYQQQVEDTRVDDLRDERLQKRSRAMDMRRVLTGGGLPAKLLFLMLGLLLGIGGLEVLALLMNKGELFSLLLD